jgi:hypothetical protein
MSWRKRSCCNSSSARSVGPGWLQRHHQSAVGSGRRSCWADVLQEFGVPGLLEVLQVRQIRHKVGLIERLLLGQEVEIDGIGEALDKLGSC